MVVVTGWTNSSSLEGTLLPRTSSQKDWDFDRKAFPESVWGAEKCRKSISVKIYEAFTFFVETDEIEKVEKDISWKKDQTSAFVL